MEAGRADAAEPAVTWSHEARPSIDDGAGGIDDDDTDLEHAVSSEGQPGGLDIDDGETHRGIVDEVHDITLNVGCDPTVVRMVRPLRHLRRLQEVRAEGQPSAARARTPIGAATV
jgi:hypothetical protein